MELVLRMGSSPSEEDEGLLYCTCAGAALAVGAEN